MFGRKKRRKDAQADSRAVATTDSQETPETPGDDTAAASDPRALGPWDESELKGEREDYIDLGCILLKPVAGVAVRMDLDEKSQRPRALNVDYQDGSVQLQAFSAPKSSGLWNDVRRELVEGLRRDSGQVTVAEGPLGLQVNAKFSATTASGQPGYRLARFVGIDGPRWFLRAVYTGGAAMPSTTAEVLDDVVRSLVIVRGHDPMPPRDLLQFKVPENATPQSPQGQTADHPGRDPQPPASAPQRGPEITEIG
ncbi:DUF3710 domain-containing protein [Kocuria sp. cx-116]|uniref:DUF3710 domain-containing protein n=1 Tax=Kocuria sp. cx-116 TaxID=2771378 RepID=UPI001682E6C0|nr:DUF3710 domain-containing protein [Kocuria sp. cx-116]MBD2761561.1 DUF3710 domain-containing protein [Kocuria sp. cx-116]